MSIPMRSAAENIIEKQRNSCLGKLRSARLQLDSVELKLQARSEGKRMASGHTGNVVPRKGLRVRISCPPLVLNPAPAKSCGGIFLRRPACEQAAFCRQCSQNVAKLKSRTRWTAKDGQVRFGRL